MEEAMKHVSNACNAPSSVRLDMTDAVARGDVKLCLTGSMNKDRYRVLINGMPVLLTAKSFKYLFKLAAHRKINHDGWLDKEELEPGFNQARYLYNLRKELSCAPSSAAEIIENNRRGSYRLGLSGEEIAVDVGKLIESEDYEIAELSRRLTSVCSN
jgi:hypothetical protein